MPSWDQLVMLIDKFGLCGLTFVLLVVHMVQEERYRRVYNGKSRRY